MAKEMVYFNATKQIETITIHYNKKLDGTFVDDVCFHIKDIAKKMGSKVNLKDPKEYYEIKVFIYPDKKMFNKVFGGEIEKRIYKRKTSLEDLYVVKDSEGNIHIVSPRGMSVDKKDALKKILVMKVLGEYMEEKEKQNAERLLKIAMKPKEEEIEEQEEVETNEVEEILEEDEQEIEEEPALEETEETKEEEDITDEELNELIAAEVVIEDLDDQQEKTQLKEEVSKSKQESREWLNVGWFMYVKGRLKKQEDVRKFAEYVSENGVKKLNKLKEAKLFENYDYSPEFACALVGFVVETYGVKKYVEFYNEPKDIKGIFGVPKFVFDAQFKAYVKEKYKSDEKMQSVMEDKKLGEVLPEYKEDKENEKEKENVIDEITQIHFTKSGGVEINEPKLENPEEPQIKM